MSAQSTTYKSYTIMEAAQLSGLPESTLRYYESIGLIGAIKRGETSRQREYTDDDINLVIAVACLSATGMSIESMRAYLGNRTLGADGAQAQIDLLDKQRSRLLEESHFMRLRQRYVDIKIEYWRAVQSGNTVRVAELKQVADAVASELKLPRDKP